MVYGITSNMIENFANFNESFHDRTDPTSRLTEDDLSDCQALIDENMNIESAPEYIGGEGNDETSYPEDLGTNMDNDEPVLTNSDMPEPDMPGPDMPGPIQGQMPDMPDMNDKSILQEMSEMPNDFDTPNIPDVGGEEEPTEEFGDYESPVYEGFTNSDFNASTLVRGRNLHNLLKALLIALVLCSLNHKDVSKMIVEPLLRLTHNKMSRTTMVCVLIFLVAYLVIALL